MVGCSPHCDPDQIFPPFSRVCHVFQDRNVSNACLSVLGPGSPPLPTSVGLLRFPWGQYLSPGGIREGDEMWIQALCIVPEPQGLVPQLTWVRPPSQEGPRGSGLLIHLCRPAWPCCQEPLRGAGSLHGNLHA